MLMRWFGKLIPEPNGCGPEGLQWAIPNLIFKPACDLHDNLFSIKAGFIKSNLMFYSRMRYLIKINRASKIKKVGFHILAFIYYAFCTTLGIFWYHRIGEKVKYYICKLFNIKQLVK